MDEIDLSRKIYGILMPEADALFMSPLLGVLGLPFWNLQGIIVKGKCWPISCERSLATNNGYLLESAETL